MDSYYLVNKYMAHRQAELIAEAERQALVRELKQAAGRQTKAGNRAEQNRNKFYRFFRAKNQPAA